MFPTKIVILPEMPMSKNLKIDRQMLLSMAEQMDSERKARQK
jgi:acyl-coenzyme A synthetase/AMP-(fatty) acid ligase